MTALTPLEAKVLAAWTAPQADTETVFHFAHIAEYGDAPAHLVRRGVRSLARKGLAEFHQFTWTNDGEPYGAGYSLTDAGQNALRLIGERAE